MVRHCGKNGLKYNVRNLTAKSDVDGAILDYCFNLHALIQASQRPQGCANDQRKCGNSRALKNITYRF